jgi:hypothetical protein
MNLKKGLNPDELKTLEIFRCTLHKIAFAVIPKAIAWDLCHALLHVKKPRQMMVNEFKVHGDLWREIL